MEELPVQELDGLAGHVTAMVRRGRDADLDPLDALLRARKAEELMLSGVTIERPETVTIDAQVRVGMDTVIEPFARLLGSTQIGEDCHIGQGAILESAALADRVVVAPYTLIADSRIDPGAQVGPFARVLSPEGLVHEIAEQFEEARAQYTDR